MPTSWYGPYYKHGCLGHLVAVRCTRSQHNHNNLVTYEISCFTGVHEVYSVMSTKCKLLKDRAIAIFEVSTDNRMGFLSDYLRWCWICVHTTCYSFRALKIAQQHYNVPPRLIKQQTPQMPRSTLKLHSSSNWQTVPLYFLE